ncbi:MAG: hypothetical protein IJJ25_08805 [Lachnospiraceae bacterium]|nr:hypothetical protein [Lachnospiraceae bacterium]
MHYIIYQRENQGVFRFGNRFYRQTGKGQEETWKEKTGKKAAGMVK